MVKVFGVTVLAAALSLVSFLTPAPSRGGDWSHGPRVRSLAVLPFIPQGDDDPREGWRIAVKMISQISGGVSVQAVNWTELSRIMEENGFDKRRLRDPAILRKIGEKLDVDGVLTGDFSAKGAANVARAKLVRVLSGSVSQSPEWKMSRDIVVRAPEFYVEPSLVVEPPVLDDENSLAMRDSVADNVCDGAMGKVDDMERSIMGLKARYWALQLRRGVHMDGIKFNPGSTISDPELRAEFYRRMKTWMKEEVVPELTPTEIVEFGGIDEKAIRLARRCGIM